MKNSILTRTGILAATIVAGLALMPVFATSQSRRQSNDRRNQNSVRSFGRGSGGGRSAGGRVSGGWRGSAGQQSNRSQDSRNQGSFGRSQNYGGGNSYNRSQNDGGGSRNNRPPYGGGSRSFGQGRSLGAGYNQGSTNRGQYDRSSFGRSGSFGGDRSRSRGFQNGAGDGFGRGRPDERWRGGYWHGQYHDRGWDGWGGIFLGLSFGNGYPSYFYSDPYYLDYSWDNIAVGVGLGSYVGDLYSDPFLYFRGSNGEPYPVADLEIDLSSGDPDRRLRAEYFERPHFYRDGARYDRVEVRRAGEQFYEFRRR